MRGLAFIEYRISSVAWFSRRVVRRLGLRREVVVQMGDSKPRGRARAIGNLCFTIKSRDAGMKSLILTGYAESYVHDNDTSSAKP